MKEALVVIDIQDCYLNQYKDKSHFTTFFKNVNREIETAMSSKIPVVYISHEINQFPLNLIMKIFMNSMGDPTKEDFKFNSQITFQSDLHFVKNKGDSLTVPDFMKWIKENKIEKLRIIGQDGNYCINSTVKGTVQRGLKAKIIKDATLSQNMKKWHRTIDKVLSKNESVEIC